MTGAAEWKRWSDKGIFAQIMAGLAAEHGEEKTVMIDAIYLKADAQALLDNLPDVDWLLGDRGYDADWFRDALKDNGIRACIQDRKQRSGKSRSGTSAEKTTRSILEGIRVHKK